MAELSDLLNPAVARLLEVAPAITDAVIEYFDNRPLDARPVAVNAAIRVDETFSTPVIALVIKAVDPTGFTDYDAQARVVIEAWGSDRCPEYRPTVTGRADGHRGEFQPDDPAPAGVGLFVAELLNENIPEESDEDE